MGTATGDEVVVIPRDAWGPDLGLVEGGGRFDEIVGRSIGATERSLYQVELAAGASTVYFRHPGDAVYYVVSGEARIQAAGTDDPLVTGAMTHVWGDTVYRLTSSTGAVLLGGPSPIDFGLYDGSSIVAAPDGDAACRGGAVTVHHQDCPGMLVPFISADARLVVWYGSGAPTANMNYVVLEPGERNKEHVHRYSADTIHILEGRGTAEDVTHGLRLPVAAGDTVHIKPGVWHAIAADRGERMVSVGGPCPADLDMLRAVGVDVDALTECQPSRT